MSGIVTTAAGGRADGIGARLVRLVRRDVWTSALVGLLLGLLAVAKLMNPRYDLSDVASLSIGALPVALAAVAQAIIVISGGIDLSLGSVMALTSVTAAAAMQAAPDASVAIVLGVIVLGLAIGAVNGTLIVVSRVPDIVVTLAMSYVWAGVALVVLGTPGGAAADWVKEAIKGSLLLPLFPKALVLLVVAVALVWVPLRRSRLGLSLYAIGSDRLAAFRSGVDVDRTRIAAYTIGGGFAALGGLVLTASTGIGSPIPGPYTLLAVAAIVLGGVSLAGGRGGLVGPILAVFVLSLIRLILVFIGVDPNYSTVVQGLIMVVVVMVGAYVTLRRERA